MECLPEGDPELARHEAVEHKVHCAVGQGQQVHHLVVGVRIVIMMMMVVLLLVVVVVFVVVEVVMGWKLKGVDDDSGVFVVVLVLKF